MSRQSWNELLAYITSDATAVANTNSNTVVVPNVTIPANYIQEGRLLRMRAFGKLSTTGTPTITFLPKWGGTGGTTLATTSAMTMASGASNVVWSLEAYIQCRTSGATGTLVTFGDVTVNLTSSTIISQCFGSAGFQTPAAVTVDLTADTALSLTCTWSAASPSNTLTAMQYSLESVN